MSGGAEWLFFVDGFVENGSIEKLFEVRHCSEVACAYKSLLTNF